MYFFRFFKSLSDIDLLFKDNEDFEIVTVRGLGYKVVKKNG